jgi:antitoxin component YwqK of YwqJK toxin-antitoxin module
MKKLIVIVAAAFLLIPAAGAQTPQVLGSKGAVVKEWNNPAGSKKQALENVFTYNEKGQLVDEIHYKDNKLVDRSIFKYDEAGKIVREDIFDNNNKFASFKTYEYDENGQCKMQYHYDAKGKLKYIRIFQYQAKD